MKRTLSTILIICWSSHMIAGGIGFGAFAPDKSKKINWFSRWSSFPKFKIIDEGENKVLDISSDAQIRPLIATFPAVSIANKVGRAITAEFDLSIIEGKPRPGELFIIGFYNSNNKIVTASGLKNSDHSSGYFGGVRRTMGTPVICKESGGNSILSLGKDVKKISSAASSYKLTEKSGFHKIKFTIQKTTAGIYTYLTVDDKKLVSASDTKVLYTTFNEFMITTSSVIRFQIRNFTISSNNINK